MNELIKKWAPEVKKYWFIPVMILLGVFLMTQKLSQPEAVTVSNDQSKDQFIIETESRVEEMLKNVEGAGNCRVTITLASSGRKEYVREDGNVLVVTDKDGNESVVISKESAPEIAGVMVASKGAGSLAVRNSIIESVSTVLGIGTNKICVVLMSG